MITLSSDFGSPYPAAMKGVVLGQADARVVDVAHDLPRQDVSAAAFWLREVLPYFPPAVHCVVVDPGVGTERAALAVRAGEHAIVAPDNGVAVPVARRLADDFDVFEVTYEDPASSTFHGRDVFAPAAASVHDAGVDNLADLPGVQPREEYTDLTFPDPTRRENGLDGTILVVDDFGNAVTNIDGSHLRDHVGEDVTVNDVRAPARRAYARVDEGSRLVTVGSHGNVELAVNRGRGDDRFAVAPESSVRLRWTD